MQRFKLIIEYDGRPFCGWQRQKESSSVQATVEDALLNLNGGERVVVHGSGRTDAGVHALGQVAHIDLAREISPEKLQGAINSGMKGQPVSVLSVEAVDDDFHARFSAVRRHYVYRVKSRRSPLTFDQGLVWGVRHPLDVDRMHEAAQVLVGQHDFTTFRHIHCQAKSPVKTMDYLTVKQVGSEIHICAGARSFLHHQIRSITGTLKLVGAGKWSKNDVKEALEARDRSALKLNAPPDGLYFKQVEFG